MYSNGCAIFLFFFYFIFFFLVFRYLGSRLACCCSCVWLKLCAKYSVYNLCNLWLLLFIRLWLYGVKASWPESLGHCGCKMWPTHQQHFSLQWHRIRNRLCSITVLIADILYDEKTLSSKSHSMHVPKTTCSMLMQSQNSNWTKIILPERIAKCRQAYE